MLEGPPACYMKDMGKTGLASARPMARRRPNSTVANVDAATRCFGVYYTCLGIKRKVI